MKKMRRIASLLLAMVMVFGMTATAWAAEVTEKVEVSVDNTETVKHTYKAYQILKGKLSPREVDGETKEYLVDIDWGDGINKVDFLEALKDSTKFKYAAKFADATNAEDVARKLDMSGESYDEALAKAFANLAVAYKLTGTDITTDNPVTLVPGYYLVVDSTVGLEENDAYNSALLQVTDSKGITIKAKYAVPKVDKSVKATADKDEVAGESTDVSIGDSVTFTLKGTLPDNYDDYEKYEYTFTDTLAKGLDYQNDAVVKLYADSGAFEADTAGNGGTPLTCTPVSETDNKGNTTLTWSFADLKKLTGVTITKDSVIVVTYTAKLTSDAKAGSEGHSNTVKLTYSNDPNYVGTGEPTTSTTPEDKVLVFTYEIDGTKVDSKDDTKKLADAKFILYRGIDGAEPGEDADGNPTGVEYALVAGGKLTGWTPDREAAKAEDNLLTSEANTGVFKLEGLDAGTYYLEETKAPAGYNILTESIKIVVTAELDRTEDSPALTKLTIKVDEEEGKDGDITSGVVSLNVENSAGVLLPSTGGMGTTLFYIVGAALVLAAGALLVMKRRTSEGR